jgi:hypothetical protein
MINLPGVKFGTNSKNRWGKKEITQYYTPVAGECVRPKVRENAIPREL